ncbi:MAG: hypothetical protein Q8M16_03130, partial [Pirellulaceae bacterium]|nr:hypothetical protein [Pirellulaceae bacterium]
MNWKAVAAVLSFWIFCAFPPFMRDATCQMIVIPETMERINVSYHQSGDGGLDKTIGVGVGMACFFVQSEVIEA